MIRILFIEDDQSTIEEAVERCTDGIENADIKVCGFEDTSDELRTFRPDVVILDILRGSSSEGDEVGISVYDFIWDNQFCPIVAYSAEPDRLEDTDHPFVAKVMKGSGSEEGVLQAVSALLPHVQALQRTENQVRQRLSEAMREVAPLAFASDEESEREEIIMRSGRRRVAAMLDDPPDGDAALASWECYIYPPMAEHPLLGDVLQISGSSKDPESFRIVLTPSCDMVRSEKQTPKVRKVLVAKCFSMKAALASIGLSVSPNPNRIEDAKRRIREGLLSSGYSQSIIPFPALKDAIPTMAANLRDLELIPIENIGNEAAFRTIASLDSPFRELVAWAYLQSSARPGLPDRDLDSWAQEIMVALQS